MNFFQRWISGIRGIRDIPGVQFGRYNEVLKSEERFRAWDLSLEAFDSGDFLEAVDQFLFYLYDPKEDNVKWERSENKIEFTVHQGSQAIEGWANSYEFQAVVQLGKFNGTADGFYEELLRHNYNLTYSKYCWRKEIIISKFSSNSLDASPYKLYAGLRELALETDKEDDLALANHQGFEPLFSRKVGALSPEELEHKVQFFQQQLEELQQSYQHCGLDPNDYPGAYTYLLLNFCYKIDYLICPEAQLMETLEGIHEDYFQGSQHITATRNKAVLDQISAFKNNDLAQWKEELYLVTNTFGFTSPLSPERLRSFIKEEIEKMDWYIQEGHREVALAIPGYIVGYCLFHYALPGPFIAFFQVFYEVLESKYFYKLGFRPVLSREGKPLKMEITRILKERINSQKEAYPDLKFSLKDIRFDSAFHFSKSYLLALCQMEW